MTFFAILFATYVTASVYASMSDVTYVAPVPTTEFSGITYAPEFQARMGL